MRGRWYKIRNMTGSDDFIRKLIEGQLEGQMAQILIADDDAAVTQVLRRSIEGEQRRIVTASSGTEAVEKVREGEYDLVVVDILMPGMDGMAVLKHVKNHSPETEVIVVTGHGTLESAIEAVRSGAADYLLKPFDDLRLFQVAVRKALSRRELVRLVQKYRAMQESATQLLQSRREQYEDLGEVARVCVGRTLQTIDHLMKVAGASLSADDKNEVDLMKKDNEELLALLDSFLGGTDTPAESTPPQD